MENRLKELRTTLNFTQIEMANILGIKQNSYSYIENGKASMTDRNKKILTEKLFVNPKWLEGDSNETTFINGELPIDDYTLEKMEREAAMLSPKEKYKNMVKLAAIYAADKEPKNEETRPRIPYTAAAGALTHAVEGVSSIECEQIPVVKIFPSYDFTIMIKGNSMSPSYESGDEVACKRIDESRFIQWGKVHVLDTTQGILIKRVYDDGKGIRCNSFNPDYPDFTIPKEDIFSMSLVVGLLRL